MWTGWTYGENGWTIEVYTKVLRETWKAKDCPKKRWEDAVAKDAREMLLIV